MFRIVSDRLLLLLYRHSSFSFLFIGLLRSITISLLPHFDQGFPMEIYEPQFAS
jgi:hypothetical protein